MENLEEINESSPLSAEEREMLENLKGTETYKQLEETLGAIIE